MAESASGKSRLICAAGQLFVPGSYSTVTVAQILEASALRPPTLYHHFEDKENLYVTWAVRAMRGTGDRIRGCSNMCEVANTLVDEPLVDLLQVRLDCAALDRKTSRQSIERSYQVDIVEPLTAAMRQNGVPESRLQESVQKFAACISFALPKYTSMPGALPKAVAVEFALSLAAGG